MLPALFLGAAHAQAPAAGEAQDFGVFPSPVLRLGDVNSPTPLEIPGAKTIGTAQLRALLAAPPAARPLLFDVLGEPAHPSLPGAIWLPGAGRGSSFDDELQARLANLLEFATRGDRSRALVFFCAGPRCWLSYNAALRAARLGYGQVRWYRGGIEAWRAAGGELAELRLRWRAPAGD